jgi:predicted dehydrogenase
MTPRIAIVGIGSIGSKHIDTLLSMGYENLVGLDPRPMPNDERLPILNNLSDVLWWKPTHAIICTPPEQHFETACPFLEHGIPTFIEKPLTHVPESASLLNDVAKVNHTQLAVGYMERANGAVQRAKEWFAEHGRVLAQIDCHWMRGKKTYPLEVVLESSHALDTALYLFGPVEKVVVWQQRPDSMYCVLNHKNGTETTVSLNMNTIPSRRIAMLANGGQDWEAYYGTSCVEWWGCYKAELYAFLNGTPLCTGDDGVAVMQVIEKIRMAG